MVHATNDLSATEQLLQKHLTGQAHDIGKKFDARIRPSITRKQTLRLYGVRIPEEVLDHPAVNALVADAVRLVIAKHLAVMLPHLRVRRVRVMGYNSTYFSSKGKHAASLEVTVGKKGFIMKLLEG